MAIKTFKNWRCEIDEQQIFWLIIDSGKRSLNTLNQETIKELDGVIDLIEEQKDNIIGVAVKSGKEQGFIAGADIEEFQMATDVTVAEALVRTAQKAFDRFESLKVPTIALIDGVTLGGGLEFALACRYRVALDDRSVVIGLPEVKLGLIPAWGGTLRLPRLIGGLKALPLMLAGRVVNAVKAKRLGIVDDVVRTKALLDRAAVYYLTKKPKPYSAGFIDKLSNTALLRPLIASRARAKLAAKVSQDHYPAPYKVIDDWRSYGADLDAGLEGEVKMVRELAAHPTMLQLVRVFFLQEQLKQLGKGHEFSPKRVHVIGAGVMGGDIAAYCALKGMTVTLQDREAKYIAPSIKRAHKLFKRKLHHRHEVVNAMDRLIPDVDGHGVSKADVVIEAIFENVEAKQALYKEIEPKLKPGALLATNTSSISLEVLAEALKKKERLIGVHFFNPVPLMMLVEVVQGKFSDDAEVKKGLAFVGSIGKLALPVKSCPGFLVNRILVPYMLEAMACMEEGIAPAAIDKAAVDFGMPMGPIELADTVGLDILYSAMQTSEAFGTKIPKKIEELVQAGHLGKKTGMGVYQWRDGKPVKVALYQQGEPPEDLTDRLMYGFYNESVACLDEEIVSSADMLDAGIIFATGWAPFRGGPMQAVQILGVDVVVERLEALAKKYGERFKPVSGWKALQTAQKPKKVSDANV